MHKGQTHTRHAVQRPDAKAWRRWSELLVVRSELLHITLLDSCSTIVLREPELGLGPQCKSSLIGLSSMFGCWLRYSYRAEVPVF